MTTSVLTALTFWLALTWVSLLCRSCVSICNNKGIIFDLLQPQCLSFFMCVLGIETCMIAIKLFHTTAKHAFCLLLIHKLIYPTSLGCKEFYKEGEGRFRHLRWTIISGNPVKETFSTPLWLMLSLVVGIIS